MSDKPELLRDWYTRVCTTQSSHYMSAATLSARNQLLGVPVIVLTAVIGTTALATLNGTLDYWVQVSLGTASVAASVLAGLQTFFGYSERAEKHRIAGAKYGSLGRQLEVLMEPDYKPSTDEVVELRKSLDKLALESPHCSLRIREKAKKRFESVGLEYSETE